MLKKIWMVSAICVCSSPVFAQTTISGNITLATDYVFRGVSQTDEGAALQGGMDIESDTGLHAGIWGSNIDFNNPGDGSLELDIYGGFQNKVGENFSYDVGGIYYAYPGSAGSLNYDYWELYVSGGYDFDVASVHAGVYYSPDFTGNTGDAVYTIIGADVPLPEDFVLSAHYAHQSIDEADNYSDWRVGVSKNWLEFDWALNYHDTDINNNDNADGRVVLSVTKTF